MFVLVAYATVHGSTRSIAERIGTGLAGAGHECRVEAVEAVPEPDGDEWFDAAVVGSPLHGQDWLPAAARFLDLHVATLSRVPLWLFSVGMAPGLHGRRGRWLAAHAKVPPAVTERRPALRPREVRDFGGVLRKSHVPLRSRPLMWACGAGFGDFRDWDAVDAWARAIGAELSAPAAR